MNSRQSFSNIKKHPRNKFKPLNLIKRHRNILFKVNENRSTNVLDTLRKKVLARGARGILGLGKLFKIMDDNHSGKLNLEEFTKAIKEYKLGIDESEIQSLFKSFDTDKSGEISYDEFIRTLRVF